MQAIIQAYSAFKVSLGDDYGLTEDLLHVHAGLLIFFATALVLRRRMRSRIPISLVYFLAIGNEVVDVFTPGHSAPSWQSAVDILNTVFWPTLLYLLARRRASRGDPDRVA
jgi:hypothetical protein